MWHQYFENKKANAKKYVDWNVSVFFLENGEFCLDAYCSGGDSYPDYHDEIKGNYIDNGDGTVTVTITESLMDGTWLPMSDSKNNYRSEYCLNKSYTVKYTEDEVGIFWSISWNDFSLKVTDKFAKRDKSFKF